MTPLESEDFVRRMLQDRGDVLERVNPMLAWDVFKRFAVAPVECEQDFLMVQLGDSGVVGDSYLVFTREFRLREQGTAWSEQLNVEFSHPGPNRLGFSAFHRSSTDYPSVDAFFASVEQMPEFTAAAAVGDWSLQIYHTGC
jgi:hypothetical protein